MSGKQKNRGADVAPPAIELSGICKSFGPIKANEDISMVVRKGTIHGIVGENGAGKSTLMSILYGFYRADKGAVFINGEEVSIKNSDDAIAAGIGMVHQHFMLVKPFSVLENVILGAEGGWNQKKSLENARVVLEKLAADYGLDVDPDAIVGELSVGLQQRVEILKALYRNAEVLILDEPTGVLTPSETVHLFRILNELKEQGKTIIFITHKLREILEITDTVSVMRRGRMEQTKQTNETNVKDLAQMMVGREVLLRVEKSKPKIGETILAVKNLGVVENGVARLKDVSFEIKAGEILGVAGVAGNGQSALLDVLSGIGCAHSGSVEIHGKPINIDVPLQAASRREVGIGHVPEDRHIRGLVTPFKVWENAHFGHHRSEEFTKGLLSNPKRMIEHSQKLLDAFDVRPNNPHIRTANLSGGNQQKVVLAREIDRNPDLLIIGQPTRGVDIGAIEYIHREIVKLRDAGKAILLVSVELEEILNLSDRVIVMFDGAISGERIAQKTNEQDLGLLMAGIDEKERVS
ncbi:MAG: ABC transporter ATP-binding protein [Nitratireductor sp.]